MAHIHEKIDFTTSAYIVHKDKVLLRKHDKYGIWIGVGGHIELHEDPNEAVVREVKEEVGLDIVLWDGDRKFTSDDARRRELVPPVALNRHPIPPGDHEHVDLVYLATSDSDQVVPENPEDEWRWLAKHELEAFQLPPDVLVYAQLALDTLARSIE